MDDGSSKFILQIRRPQYWRIEIPNESAEDKLRSEELKVVLGQVLLFEKTACPFQRSFTIELPKAPETPIKKRPWRPVARQNSEPILGRMLEGAQDSPGNPATLPISTFRSASISESSSRIQKEGKPPIAGSGSRTPIVPAEPLLEESFIKPDPFSACEVSPSPAPRGTSLVPSFLAPSIAGRALNDLIVPGEDSDGCSDYTDDTNITPRNPFQRPSQPLAFDQEEPSRPEALQKYSKPVTAPPVLSLITSPPSKQRSESPIKIKRSDTIKSDASSLSSVESFYSTQSWHSPLAPPSPPVSPTNTNNYPYPHNNITMPMRPQNARETSEITATPGTPFGWEINDRSPTAETSSSSPSKPPTLVSDRGEKSDEEHYEAVTPPAIRSTVRHRATTSSNSRRRTLSPLPAAVNLFSPSRRRPRHLQTTRHLPTAIIQKTCEILLSPPGHLLHLMINIATKIAAGEWRGVLSGYGEAVHWDFSEDEYSGDGWGEDDYGISVAGHPPSQTKRSTTNDSDFSSGGSWEID